MDSEGFERPPLSPAPCAGTLYRDSPAHREPAPPSLPEIAMRTSGFCLVFSVATTAGAPAAAADHWIHSFRKVVLTDVYLAEGASTADFDQDRHADVVSGPYWYSGPDFRRKHEIYPPRPQDVRAYADNF